MVEILLLKSDRLLYYYLVWNTGSESTWHDDKDIFERVVAVTSQVEKRRISFIVV